jgi:hypothetical protein
MKEINAKFPYDQELPPLPDRAIHGLQKPWIIPTEEPFHTVSLWEFKNLYVLIGHEVWFSLVFFLRGNRLAGLAQQLQIGVGVLKNIIDNPDQSIVVPKLRKLCLAAGLDLDIIEKRSY